MSETAKLQKNIGAYAEYYHRYVSLVPEGDVVSVLSEQIDLTVMRLRSIPEDAGDYRYGDDKWTVKELIGHLVDTERVMAARALAFARGDKSEYPGMDQDEYVLAGEFAARSLNSLISELECLRRANVLLFEGLSSEAWKREGVASENKVSVNALARIIAGHELYHMAIFKERYLPGLVKTGKVNAEKWV
ncbi:MAG: DinB family protein [Pyrinomonadaceae bacterium]